MEKDNKTHINKMSNANSTAASVTGVSEKSENLKTTVDVSAEALANCPGTVDEMINTYGTYNIQPTSDSVNDFPAIAQGETKEMKERSLEFFRGPDDPNPAADMSDEDCI